jgi:membrane fusion protein (multidrug efflux system)
LQQLLTNNSVSRDRVDQARAEADIALANVRQLEASIAKKTLRAPFDAVVGLHQLEAGEYLAANTAIVTLVGISEFLWVDFNLPPAQGSVDIGATVAVFVAGHADAALQARVIARDPAVSPQSRNLRYRARLDAAPGIPARIRGQCACAHGPEQPDPGAHAGRAARRHGQLRVRARGERGR